MSLPSESLSELGRDTLSETTPLLAGFAVIQQRETNLDCACEPIDLMIKAAKQAAQDAGSPALLQFVECIYVPKGLWSYPDPGRLIADAIGATAHTVLADFGILQQTLMGDACERIARGEIRCALIAGSEAKFRQLQAHIQGVLLTELPQHTQPDETMTPAEEMTLAAEVQAGLMMPVGFYALMESALRFERGETVDENRDRLAALYSRMSAIAAENPHAWKREVVTAEAIRNAEGKNRLLAFPYTKYHNSEWNVDQACALLLCSKSLADELGVAASKRVYPLASSESNHMLCLSQREHIAQAPGANTSLEFALKHAGITIDELDLLELYSCFPAAVQVFAEAAGVDTASRDTTVTGGMPFAGGPLNNYVLQATCRMAELLRESALLKCYGAVSSVSGMMTKQAWGLWSNQPPVKAFAFLDVSEQVAANSRVLTVLDQYEGAVTIVAYTVLFQGDHPVRAIVIADTADRQRVLAWSENISLMHDMMATEWCGRQIHVNIEGEFR